MEAKVSRKVRRGSRRAVLVSSGAALAAVAASATGKAASVVYEVSIAITPGAEPDEFTCRALSQSPESGRVQEAQSSVRRGQSITLQTTDVRPDGSKIEAIVDVSADASGRYARVTSKLIDRDGVVRVKDKTIDLPRR